MTRASVFAFVFMLSFPAQAQEIPCTQEIIEWQDICLAYDVLDGDGCDISDLCVVEKEAVAEDIIKDAAIEIPKDTPKGFQEQIYIIP